MFSFICFLERKKHKKGTISMNAPLPRPVDDVAPSVEPIVWTVARIVIVGAVGYVALSRLLMAK